MIKDSTPIADLPIVVPGNYDYVVVAQLGLAGKALAPEVTAAAAALQNGLDLLLAEKGAAADAVLGGLGYLPPVAYEAGIALSTTRQTVEHGGNVYAPIDSFLPFTTIGTFEPTKFRLIQGIAYSDLAGAAGASLVGFQQAGAGAVLRTGQDKSRERVSPEDYSSFAQAVTYASANNRVLELRDGASYTLTADLTVSGSLRLRGRGTIRMGANVSGIVVEPPRSVSTSVSAISTVNFPAGNGIEQASALTVASTAGLARGDVCQLRSTDTYSFDSNIKRGELVKINEIVGSTVHLAGVLVDSYTTGIVLEKLNPAVVDIDGPEFTYDGDPLAPTAKTRFAAVTLIGCVSPRVRATFHDDLADGLRMFSCWMPDVDVRCYNLRNNTANSLYGYGVAAYGSCTRGMVRVLADNVRHAYTDGTWNNTLHPIRDGRCVDMSVYDSVAINCTFASFDTHPGSVNTRFVNCGVVYNQTNTDQPTKDNAYAFQDRALNTKYIDCWSRGVRTPFWFGSVLQSHGEKNTTEVIGGRFERDGTSSTAFNALPTKTSLDVCEVNVRDAALVGYLPSQSAQTETVLKFHGVRFLGDGSYGWSYANSNGGMEFSDCVFREITNLRLGQNNNFSFIGCRRYNSGTFIEPIIPGVGSTCLFHDLYVEAPSYGFGQLIRAGQGTDAGTVTLFVGSIYAKNYSNASAIGTNGTATLSMNNMDIRQKPVKKGSTASRPGLLSSDVGFLYLDTTLDPDGKPVWWTGTSWVDATGALV